MRHLLIVFIMLISAALGAAEAPQVAAFKKAMAGQDFQAKRAAIAALGSVQDDDVVYALLISALSDRQANKAALEALQSRSGLRPSQSKGGNTGYPGYPSNNSAGAWSTWNNARKEKIEADARLKEAEEKAAEAKEQAAKAEEVAKGETDPADEGTLPEGTDPDKTDDQPATNDGQALPPELLGQLDRIFFKDGSILVGYITVRRRDMTGKLTSIHIVHESGGGEEDIDAALISRIEDDIE